MFRIPIRVLHRAVATQFRRSSAAALNNAAEQQENQTQSRVTNVPRNEIYAYREQIRNIVQEKCVKLSQVGTLNREEAAAEFESLSRFLRVLNEKLNLEHPFADLIGYCRMRELSIVDDLYRMFTKSEEFNKLVSDTENPRPHLFTPAVIMLVNELKSGKLNDPAVCLKRISDFLNDYFEHYTQPESIDVLIQYLLSETKAEFLVQVIASVKKHGRTFNTYLVTKLLVLGKMDRLKELMECKLKTDADIRIFANRITSVVIRKLKTIKLDVPSSSQELQTIAQLLALGFRGGNADSTGSQALTTIFMSNAVSDEVLKRIVDILMEDSKVLVNKQDIGRIETQLCDANQQTRAKLIFPLKQKNPAHARWINTHDLSELENEAKNLEKKDGMKPEVLASLYNVILSKSSNPLILNTLTWLLPKFHDLLEHKLNAMDSKLYRYSLNSTLRVAVDQSLLHRQYEAFDQLWELRPFYTYPADKILVIAFSFIERGLTEKASKILKMLAESTINLDEKTLNQVVSSEFMRSVTSEQLIESFSQMLAEHFNVTADWHQRLLDSVQLNDLRNAINEGNLDGLNEKINQMGDTIVRDVATSFILIDLFKAAIKANNAQVFSKAKEIIDARRDRHTTVLYIGLSFLELHDQRWPTMLKKINHIPTDIMTQLINRERNAKRADVLHILFHTLNKSGMPNIDLEILLRETVSVYNNTYDLTGLRKLYDEVKASNFYMRTELKASIEFNIKRLERELAKTSDAATPQPPPKSSSPSENHPLKQ